MHGRDERLGISEVSQDSHKYDTSFDRLNDDSVSAKICTKNIENRGDTIRTCDFLLPKQAL